MAEESAAGVPQVVRQGPWRTSLVLFTMIVLAAMWAFMLWGVQQSRRNALDTSHRQLVTLAKGFGLQLEAMFADGVGAALAAAQRMSASQPQAVAEQQLADVLTGGDYVRALFVLEPERLVIANRPGGQFEAVSAEWRTQLLQRRESVWVGSVIQHAGKEVFPVAQRLSRADGSQLWAGAWFSFDELDGVYADLAGSQSYVSAVGATGRILRRMPPQQTGQTNIDIRGSDASAQFRAAPVSSVTMLTMPQPDTGMSYQYAIYRVKEVPLLAIAARSVDAALLSWRDSRDSRVLLLTLATLFVLGLAIAAQILLNRRWGDLHALAEARRAQLQVRESLASGLLLAQDAERKRLANELHDGVGQTLSMLRNRVVQLRRAGLPPDGETQARAILDLVTESIEDLRGVAHSLRPMHLEELGVTSALRGLLERVQNSSDGLTVHARIEDMDDVVQAVAATHVYRIVQEAINNALKHSAAANLWVEVIRDIAWVEIHVRDDGVGLHDGRAGKPRGLGLISIGERCRMLGATLTVVSNQPVGTHLCLRLPVETLEELSA
ncbi:MAG: histidine kinase [Steroidobacteraceae bacterium]